MSGELWAAWISIFLFAATFLAVAIYASTRKPTGAHSFAIGGGAGPIAVGMSLATTMTSAAVFLVNPGLVYTYGVSALLAFVVAANGGVILGLLVLVKGFRQAGMDGKMVSVPQWIAAHYGGGLPLRLFYALTSLLLMAYLVLIFVGLTLTLQQLLGISVNSALIGLIVLVLLYNQIGGANAHLYTNFIQGIVMIVVAVLLVVSGQKYFTGGFNEFFQQLGAMDPLLIASTNPKSIFFRDFFETIICNVMIGFAIVCQPHILSKGLFLKNNKDVNKFLFTSMMIGTLFSAVMVVGLFARFALGPDIPSDMVMPRYIVENFGPFLRILLTLGVLCAGLSTLEAILLTFSVIFAYDIILPIAQARGVVATPGAADYQWALKWGRVLTVLSGVVIYFLAMNQINFPNVSVATFAFNGVYALFAATFFPIACRIFRITISWRMCVFTSAMVLVIHFGMSYGKVALPGLNPLYWINPTVNATFAIIAGILAIGVYLGRKRWR